VRIKPSHHWPILHFFNETHIGDGTNPHEIELLDAVEAEEIADFNLTDQESYELQEETRDH
jgi:hypothetical protein